MPGPYKIFAIFDGYVESRSNYCFVVRHRDGFGSATAGLKSLGEAFLEGMTAEEDYIGRLQSCDKCKNEKRVAGWAGCGFKRCPFCGHLLEKKGIDWEDLVEHIRTYMSGVADGTHDTWQALDTVGWESHMLRATMEDDAVVAVTAFGPEIIASLVDGVEPEEDIEMEHHVEVHTRKGSGVRKKL